MTSREDLFILLYKILDRLNTIEHYLNNLEKNNCYPPPNNCNLVNECFPLVEEYYPILVDDCYPIPLPLLVNDYYEDCCLLQEDCYPIENCYYSFEEELLSPCCQQYQSFYNNDDFFIDDCYRLVNTCDYNDNESIYNFQDEFICCEY